MSSKEVPEYFLGDISNEVERLTVQSRVIKYAMKDKPILAPLDLSRPGLLVLDIATADGTHNRPSLSCHRLLTRE